MNFAILLSNNNRSKAYVQNMVNGGFIPSQAIVLRSDHDVRPENTAKDLLTKGGHTQHRSVGVHQVDLYFNDTEHVEDTLANAHVDTVVMNTLNVNSDEVVEAVGKFKSDYVVYSGPGGTILGRPILDQGKEFIHVHPGWLPEYRGSTTMYYSLLVDRSISCSVILMRPTIDAGPILFRKKFQICEPDPDYDYVLDPCLRTAALMEFLANYQDCLSNPIDQTTEKTHLFYIIHPVLKHLSILRMQGSM